MEKQIFSMDYMHDELNMNLLDQIYEHFKEEKGYVFYKFPGVKEIDMPILYPDIFILSAKHGLILIISDDISIDRNGQVDKICNKAEKIDTMIFSLLMREKGLRKNNRSLKFEVNTLKYLPDFENQDLDSGVFVNYSGIINCIEQISLSDDMPEAMMQEIISVLDASGAIVKAKERQIEDDDVTSQSYVLKYIESQIAKLDNQQRLAALTNLDGPQRIRGLAGSGKTIVLSLKAAYLHLNHPNSRIVYTFSTRSLYDYIQQLITRFYMKISDGRVPDFESGIKIMHAWGGKNVPGLYYYACMENNINTIDYSTASRNKGEKEDAFSYVCSDFIKKTEYNAEKIFDFILMDEAQDFNANFYQLCRSIVKDDHLIWGYDELQNIFNVKIQNTKDTFQNEFDKTGLDLEALNDCNIDNDIVLPKSYRNIKKILMAAVSVGFGVYNNILIQSLENNNHWIDLGFEVYEGDCSKQEDVKIRRLDKNSPLKLPDTYKDDDILRHYSATNLEDEIDFVYQKILFALKQGKLREDDIAVICLDDRNNKAYLNELEMRLSESGIACNNIMDRNYVKGFSLERKITLTSVYKAKGNEAAMVFVVGCDVFEDQKDSRTMRNKIFTAFTRAKIWLCISGVNIADRCLIKELDTLKNNNYELHFKNTPHSILERDWHKQTKRVADQNEFAIQIRNLLNRKTLDTKDLHSIIDEISGGKKNNE